MRLEHAHLLAVKSAVDFLLLASQTGVALRVVDSSVILMRIINMIFSFSQRKAIPNSLLISVTLLAADLRFDTDDDARVQRVLESKWTTLFRNAISFDCKDFLMACKLISWT